MDGKDVPSVGHTGVRSKRNKRTSGKLISGGKGTSGFGLGKMVGCLTRSSYDGKKSTGFGIPKRVGRLMQNIDTISK